MWKPRRRVWRAMQGVQWFAGGTVVVHGRRDAGLFVAGGRRDATGCELGERSTVRRGARRRRRRARVVSRRLGSAVDSSRRGSRDVEEQHNERRRANEQRQNRKEGASAPTFPPGQPGPRRARRNDLRVALGHASPRDKLGRSLQLEGRPRPALPQRSPSRLTPHRRLSGPPGRAHRRLCNAPTCPAHRSSCCPSGARGTPTALSRIFSLYTRRALLSATTHSAVCPPVALRSAGGFRQFNAHTAGASSPPPPPPSPAPAASSSRPSSDQSRDWRLVIFWLCLLWHWGFWTSELHSSACSAKQRWTR